MFRAFYNRSYRVYWTGNLVSQIGSWIQGIARPWLVYQITGSAFALGYIAFLGTIPLLFLSLFGGVAADRMNRKNLIVVTQTLYMTLAFVMAALVWTHAIRVWHVALISLLSGIVTAYDIPARQTMVTDMVGREDLMNAIALNSASFNMARILGPALAGYLVEWIGIGGCFFVDGVSFLAIILPLYRLQIDQHPPEKTGNVWASMAEGIRYIRSQPRLVAIMSVITVSSIFAMPYSTLMPAIAKEAFHTNAAGLGDLFSAIGLGALIGALYLARKSGDVSAGFVTVSAIGLGASLAAFGLTRNFYLGLAALPFFGFFNTSQNATANTLVQIIVPDRLRGRVMSTYMMIFQGVMPFGNLLAGVTAERWGSPQTLEIGGWVQLAYGAIIAFVLTRMGPPSPASDEEKT